MQLSRVAAQESAREQREELRRAALIGYQFYICQPVEKGHKHKTWSQWLKGFGLDRDGASELAEDQKALIRQQAEENVRKVIDMFRRKPIISREM